MNNNSRALKSGVWYTAANFLTKSIGLITAPLFNRLLTENELGAYGNYTSWLSVMAVFITLTLESTFISARFEFEKEFDSYVSTMMLFSGVSAAVWFAVFQFFSGAVSGWMNIDISYIRCMCLYLAFLPVVNLFQAKERYRMGYQKSVLISCLTAVGTALVSVLLVAGMQNRLAGRIWGSALPTILIGIVLAVLSFRAGHAFKFAYIRYALPICLPFIPHLLSMTFLNSLDKMMITDICGEEENAFYTVAYQCSSVVTILVTSLNTAFSPWLGEKLHHDAYAEIRAFSKKYVLIFLYFAVGIMLLSPDIMLVIGGRSYMKAKYVMPPVMLGCVCQFIYTMYVNVEQFKKKTVGMAAASASAALSNYVLNALLIPRFGYIAAAYTTLISFAWLLGVHIFLVWRIGYSRTYPNRFILLALGAAAAVTAGVNVLYQYPVLRYLSIAVYAGVFIYGIIRCREAVMKFIRRLTEKEIGG